MEEYEYKVQHRNLLVKGLGWSDSGLARWENEAAAVSRFKEYVGDEKAVADEYGGRLYEYRIVRRPKDSETVYLTEQDEI